MVDEVLTVEETARLLKVTNTTVRRWCLLGWLPAFKIGRAWRIPRDELERLMEPAGPHRPQRRFPRLSPSLRQAEDKVGLEENLWSRMSGYYEQFKTKEVAPDSKS